MGSEGSEKRVLVLAPWGLPTRWYEVSYVIPKVSDSGKLCTRPIDIKWDSENKKSYTSLAGVLQYIINARHEGPIDVVIMGLDTLAFTDADEGKKCDVRVDNDGKTPSEILSDFAEKLRSGNNVAYSDIRKAAHSLLKGCAEQYLKDFENKITIDIKILPGIGTYKAHGYTARFMGGINNLIFAMLYELYSKVRDGSYSAVVLDLTHGVNYLPVISYSAAQLIAKYLSARDNRKICFITFNADPVPGAVQESRLNIIDMQNIRVEPHEFLRELINELSEEKIYKVVKSDYDKDKINKLNELNNQYDDVRQRLDPSRITASLEYGFTLYLITYLHSNMKNLEKLSGDISNLCGEIHNYIHSEVDIKVTGSNDKDGSKMFLISRFYDFDTSPLLLSMAFDVVRSRIINALHFDQIMDSEEGVDIDHLLDIPVSNVANKTLTNEVSTIKNVARIFKYIVNNFLNVKITSYVKYDSAYDLADKTALYVWRRSGEIRDEISNYLCGGHDKCEPNYRNFIAHAGLERTTICVKVVDDKVFIKYRSSDCFKSVNEIVGRIIRG
ncbi:CRISPR-associated CARF protein Csx1 [Vulcanisaeta thermophila]|uniref:CRISPR-associated CARF protein Csx1 n=1 Tax=Vulcanisaeta thermophila TaxID=867917 RepID=UPI000852E8B7|nr:CRISPR-associated CARF protein Csx1 [Vulcanisaeta thermophila]